MNKVLINCLLLTGAGFLCLGTLYAYPIIAPAGALKLLFATVAVGSAYVSGDAACNIIKNIATAKKL